MELQLTLDVVYNLRRCRRRKRKNRFLRKELPYPGNLEVRRPEVVAPLANAVSLIDCNETDFYAAQLFQEHLAGKSFR